MVFYPWKLLNVTSLDHTFILPSGQITNLIGLLNVTFLHFSNCGFSFGIASFLTVIFLIRKNVVFGKLIQGKEVLKKIEHVGDEEGKPTVTVKIIRCGEYSGGTNILLLVTSTYVVSLQS